MNAALPPLKGETARISGSTFNSRRDRAVTGNTHAAIDFNYSGRQGGVCRTLPPVFSPVSGTVTFAGGDYNAIKIRDSKGMSHEFLHCSSITVKVGQVIQAGTKIGRMGGKGPKGIFAFDIHVHYQLRDPNKKYSKNALEYRGGLIDPVAYWDGNKQAFTEPMSDTDENLHANDEGHYNQEPSQPFGNIEEYIPRQAGGSSPSESQIAVWTNRVPSHEPWPRTMMVNTKNINAKTDEIEFNTRHNPQFTDDTEEGSKSIGIVEGDDETLRGPFWRR